jgi:hypothetical protein
LITSSPPAVEVRVAVIGQAGAVVITLTESGEHVFESEFVQVARSGSLISKTSVCLIVMEVVGSLEYLPGLIVFTSNQPFVPGEVVSPSLALIVIMLVYISLATSVDEKVKTLATVS